MIASFLLPCHLAFTRNMSQANASQQTEITLADALLRQFEIDVLDANTVHKVSL